jgi:hypothetical protein
MQRPDSKALAHDKHPLTDELIRRQQRQAQRLALIVSSLAEMKVAMEESRFVRALAAFRQAANLSREFAALREIVCNTAIEQAEQLTSRNWRVAESLLNEAFQLDSSLAIPPAIGQSIQRERREESVGNVLAEATRAEATGSLPEVRQRLAFVLGNYPEEARLKSRLASEETRCCCPAGARSR